MHLQGIRKLQNQKWAKAQITWGSLARGYHTFPIQVNKPDFV